MTLAPVWIVEVASDAANWNPTPTWIDVTSRVRQDLQAIAEDRGADSLLDKKQAGQLTSLALDNNDGQLSPASGSVVSAAISSGQAIRLRARYPQAGGTVYPMYWGWQLTPQFMSAGVDDYVLVTAADSFSKLAQITLDASFFEMQAKALAPRGWWPLNDSGSGSAVVPDGSTASQNTGGVANDIGQNSFVGEWVANATDPYIAIADPLLPQEITAAGQGGTDFGTIVGHSDHNFVMISNTQTPPGAGAGLGNMADTGNRGIGPTTVPAGMDPSLVGGAWTIVFTIQLRRKGALGGGVFTQWDPYTQTQQILVEWTDNATPTIVVAGIGINQWTDLTPMDGKAHRVAFSYDTSDGIVRYYCDGVLKGSAIAGNATTYATQELIIGANYAVGSVSTTGCALSNFMIYDFPLTSDQLLWDYQSAAAPGAGDGTGDRVARLLGLLGVPGAFINCDHGDTLAPPSPLNALGSTALAYCQLCETTEVGNFFVDGAGVFQFRSRSGMGTGSALIPLGVFGDRPDIGELPYTESTYGPDATKVFNTFLSTRMGGTQLTFIDEFSREVYGEVDLSEDNLLLYTDRQVERRQEYLDLLYAQPSLSVLTLTVDPALNDGAWVACMSADLGDRIIYNRRSSDGLVFLSQVAVITRIQLTASRSGGHVWVFSLNPSIPQPWLILDDPVHGSLDGANLLAW
jgi:hypothetical protein